MEQPLVSILINNYNNGPYLAWCLDSAIKQDYPHLEVIVYDDASSDHSLEVLAQYGEAITLIAAEKNYGAASINFNQSNAIYQAFLRSKGEIICLLDGDDAFKAGKVRAVVEAFAKAPQAVLVQHYFEVVNGQNQSTGVRKPFLLYDPQTDRQTLLDYYQRTHSLFDLYAQTSALSFRRSYLEQRLPLPEDELDMVWPDVRLTRLAPFYGKVVTLSQKWGFYRVHDSNWIHTLDQEKAVQKARSQIYTYFNQAKPDPLFPTLSLNKANQHPPPLRLTWTKRWRKIAAKVQAFLPTRG